MAARKKNHAVLRTGGLFTGMTAMEEAALLLDAPDAADDRRAPAERDIVGEAEENAIKWLGMDVFHEGDDLKIAVHPEGHAVLILVDTSKSSDGSAYATRSFRLSAQQWTKLRSLTRKV